MIMIMMKKENNQTNMMKIIIIKMMIMTINKMREIITKGKKKIKINNSMIIRKNIRKNNDCTNEIYKFIFI